MKIVICDDQPDDREKCRAMLQSFAEKNQLEIQIETFSGGQQMLFELEEEKAQPGIIFLDVRMPEITGPEAAKRLRGYGCKSEIVFFTVSKENYTDAFDVEALHYIVKDETTPQKVEEIFLKAVRLAEEKNSEYICCTWAGTFKNIEIKNIRYFEIIKRIITVHFNENESFRFYSTIGKIENQLRDKEFIRVHQSILVAIEQIERISFKELQLKDGTILPVSRSYYPALKKTMTERAV